MHFIGPPKKILRPRHLKFEKRSIFYSHIFHVSWNKGPKNTARVSFVLNLVSLLELLVIKGILRHLIKIIHISYHDEFMVLALHLRIITGKDALFGHLKSVTYIPRLTKDDAVEHI